MGKIIDSTDKITGAIQQKTRLDKNLDKNNFYMKRFQQKMDYEWRYRHNVIDIEEENILGSEIYEPIESIIQSVFDIENKKNLSNSWKKLTFKDIKHPTAYGKRYRFATDFSNTDVDDIDKNIWITVNFNTTVPKSSVVVRRCDTNLVIVSKEGTIHKEPAIIEDDFKSVNSYYDETITTAQAEIYAIMQYNKYTKNIVINDRFLIGPVDEENRENNSVFKVKAVRRFKNSATYKDEVSMVSIALDRDDLGGPETDNLTTRVVAHSPYYVESDTKKIEDDNEYQDESIDIDKQYHIEVITQDGSNYEDKILLNKERQFECKLLDDDNIEQQAYFTVVTDLLSTENDIYYYDFIQDNNKFSILNKKMYLKDKLKIVCSTTYNGKDFEKVFYIKLGGNT